LYTISKNNPCLLCGSKKVIFYIKNYRNIDYYRCKQCDFVFTNSISINYSELSWTNTVDPDGVIRNLVNERQFKLKNWYGGISSIIKKRSPGKIIDIGAGLGFLLSDIPNTWEKHGIELSKFARSYIKKNNSIKLIDDLILDKKSPSENYLNAYDVVVCYHVIEHIKNPDLFFKHLTMLVKPNGILIIGTPNIDSITSKIFKGNYRMLGEGHVGLFNTKNLSLLFNKYGIDIINVEYPFFKTKYFSFKNCLRLFNPNKISPPFYRNIMTFYGKKK